MERAFADPPFRYKIPFAIQWVWPIPIIVGTFLAPESPWWCVRHGYHDRARSALRRLARRSGFDRETEDRQLACGFTYLYGIESCVK
jgi:SP family general alpha glucoside:H+ symporter-like MFS transporter